MAREGLISRLPLIFYYHRLNRLSFNALAGALDGDAELSETEISLPRTLEELKIAVAALLGRHDRIIVAISALTCQFEAMRSVIAQFRLEYGSKITFLAGGPHATADTQAVLHSGIDIVFRGEAEVTFPLVLKRLASGQEFGDVTGIACRENGESFIGSRAHPVEIEAYPSFSPRRKMFGPIEITRGCAFACSYCQTSHIFGTRPRHRSIASIVRQAGTLRSRNAKVIRLLSPNAFAYGSPDGRQLNLAALNELLTALREAVATGGRIIFGYFPSEIRPEHVTPETLELLRKYADNDEIVIGAQSGSQRVLDACHRSHDVAAVLTAVSLARRFGFKVIVDFIFGLPGESASDVRETVSVMNELARLGARIHPHLFAPLPQTAFAAEPPGAISQDIFHALEQLRHRRAIYGNLMP